MDYSHLTPDDRAEALRTRLRGLESEHHSTELDIQTLEAEQARWRDESGLDDEEWLAQAPTRVMFEQKVIDLRLKQVRAEAEIERYRALLEAVEPEREEINVRTQEELERDPEHLRELIAHHEAEAKRLKAKRSKA